MDDNVLIAQIRNNEGDEAANAAAKLYAQHDTPQFAVLSREVGSTFINIYSRHATRRKAEEAKDRAAWRHNAQGVTYRLTVVEL